MSIERRLHHGPLHAAPASMHDTHLPKSRGQRRPYVFLDDRGNVARREGMKVDLGPNWHNVHETSVKIVHH